MNSLIARLIDVIEKHQAIEKITQNLEDMLITNLRADDHDELMKEKVAQSAKVSKSVAYANFSTPNKPSSGLELEPDAFAQSHSVSR